MNELTDLQGVIGGLPLQIWRGPYHSFTVALCFALLYFTWVATLQSGRSKMQRPHGHGGF